MVNSRHFPGYYPVHHKSYDQIRALSIGVPSCTLSNAQVTVHVTDPSPSEAQRIWPSNWGLPDVTGAR